MSDGTASTGLVTAPPELAAAAHAWSRPLVAASGPEFRALYLHGSALRPGLHDAGSDVNLLLVLRQLPYERLDALSRALATNAKSNAKPARRYSPLVLTESQVHRSLDVFPGEFLDLCERRALLEGEDVLAGLQVSLVNLRHQCEFELRSKLLGLRQAFLRSGAAPESAQHLTAQAAGGSAALFRHLLRLADRPRPDHPDELVRDVAVAFHVEAAALAAPFAARRQDERDTEGATARFAAYLTALESLIVAVDALPES